MGFRHFLPEVDQGITHSAQRSIDAYAGLVGYLLKAHVHVVAHNEHLLLLRRQFLNKVAEASLSILGNLERFGRILGKVHGIEKAAVVFQDDFWIPAASAVSIDGQVMRNSANPGEKLALFIVTTTFDGIYSLDKGLLKEVFRPVTVLYNQVNGRKNARFVTMEQHFECLFVTLLIKRQ